MAQTLSTNPPTHNPAPTPTPPHNGPLAQIADKVLWLSTAIVDAANSRPNPSGIKVGGHQASSASMIEIMVALWFDALTAEDRVSVKPHAAPVLHAINYLLGDLHPDFLTMLRQKDGLQSYPSRSKDPDTVDFSTGSVGIGATATIWAALAHRYARSHFAETPPAGRFYALLGDAELDEGAIWEAVADPAVASLGELVWVVDMNRQSLDRIVPGIQIQRLQGMFEAAGWEVIVLRWGRHLQNLFAQPGGEHLRNRLTQMSNEEYQRTLRASANEVTQRLLAGANTADLQQFLARFSDEEIATAVRDLGGHDIPLLTDTFKQVATDRPTVIFAYTIKGHRLPTEGHPSNHSALLSNDQITQLAHDLNVDPDNPWAQFPPDSPAARLCNDRADVLQRPEPRPTPPLRIPHSLNRPYRRPVSTQAVLGRILSDLAHEAPEVAARIVTTSPDVASSTNLGGWINKTGIWSPQGRPDWFADDAQRLLRWAADNCGQHIELGIAEVNLVGLISELGATWSRWGQRLLPVGTIYDPFVGRALEPWSFGIYAGGQSILIGTPSGVSLSAEGGAHQSITTPSIGIEQPGCVAWEPAFAQDLEWTFLHATQSVGVPGGQSHYFRLSTRPIDPNLANIPDEPHLQERRRQQVAAGGYQLRYSHDDHVTLVGAGAIMPEVIAAADALAVAGIRAGVVCLTSADLVWRSLQQRDSRTPMAGGAIIDELFPPHTPTPLVTVMDGHPHTLAFLASARGDRTRNLGVSDFGESTDLHDAYQLHRIDTATIVDTAMSLINDQA